MAEPLVLSAPDHFMCSNKKSVTTANGRAARNALFASFLFRKNVIWPLIVANFILVSEKAPSKMQICSKKPLSGGLHDLLMRSPIRSCSAVFAADTAL